jgi:thymidylate synthase
MIELSTKTKPLRAWREAVRLISKNHHTLATEKGEQFYEAKTPISITICDPEILPTSELVPHAIQTYFSTKFIDDYAVKFSSGIAEEGDWSYSYGERISRDDQLNKVISLLNAHNDTRRATISLLQSNDIDLEDKPCLSLINFRIREKDLIMEAIFRSHDFILGYPINYVGLLFLGTRVACETDTRLSEITTVSLSAHYYTREQSIVDLITFM